MSIVDYSTLGMVLITVASGIALASSTVYADDSIVDRIDISVPVSCSLSGTIVEEHSDIIENGLSKRDIGTTEFTVYCNDNSGFAIYATGFTGDVAGEENSTKMISLENSGGSIMTGVDTNGGSSSWAMKLIADDEDEYPLEILSDDDGSYSNYHIIPGSFKKVAKRVSSTDVGVAAVGSTITSTYQVYIAPYQPAGSYVGQVKYVLVHPSSISYLSTEYVDILFETPDDSNMLFSDGGHTNEAKLRLACMESDGDDVCEIAIVEGEYKQPSNYQGAWTINVNETPIILPVRNEKELVNLLVEVFNRVGSSADEVIGSSITVKAYRGNTIFYNGNGATAGDMTGTVSRFNYVAEMQMEVDVPVSYTELVAPNFKKDGYGFVGWSNDRLAVPGEDQIFGPNQTVTLDDIDFDNNGVGTLYAVWLESSGTMQNFSCANLNIGDVVALTDNRDNSVYTVGKLADGGCWMMENLRLSSDATLNNENTDHPAISKLSASIDDWCLDSSSVCLDVSKINTNNISFNGVNASGNKLLAVDTLRSLDYAAEDSFVSALQWFSYGNLYNWYSATAGTGTRAVDDGNATGSICPAGWHLPSGGPGGEFAQFDVALGGTGDSDSQDDTQEGTEMSAIYRSYPNNYVYSGYWNMMGARYRGFFGYYWFSTASSESGVYRFLLADTMALPSDNFGDKYYGFAVRCRAN